MAKKEKHGWIWDEQEKELILSLKSKLRTRCLQLNTQLSRFEESLPAYSEEANNTAKPYLNLADELLSLDGRTAGRKYQQMSPEDVRGALKRLEILYQAWVLFTNRADIQEAIRERNRDMRKEARGFKSAALKKIESEEYKNQLEMITDALIVQAGQVVPLSGGFLSPSKLDKKDKEILQRLLLVHFVRFSYEFHADRKEQMRKFLEAHPEGTLKDVITHAVYIVIKSHILKSSPMISPQKHIQSLFLNSFEGLTRSFAEWRDKKQSLKKLDKDYFTILGADFSLTAKSEKAKPRKG